MGDSARMPKAGRERLPDLPTVGNQKKWNYIKIVLRSVSLVLSTVDVAELIALQTSANSLDYWPSVAYPVLAGFILWDIVEFVVIIVRESAGKGVHPGAHVGVELILWLGSVFTITAQALRADWGTLGLPDWELRDEGVATWVYVALTQFSFLSFVTLLRFVLFVRACVEVDRRKKDRRIQQLVFAIQNQGRNPQDVPLSAFKRARELDHASSSVMLKALSTSSPESQSNASSSHSAGSSTSPPRSSRSAPEEQDFNYKYNFTITTVSELLESGIHPEDARNQKVLIETFPR